MPLDEGAAQLREVAVRLRETGQVELRLAMTRNIRLATAPAGDRVRESARQTLPKRGGLNEWVAEAVVKTSVTSGARTAGVSLRMRRPGHDLKSINAGFVRHPVFGRWVAGQQAQPVRPGFFTDPLERMQPEVTAACVAAMREAAVAAGFR